MNDREIPRVRKGCTHFKCSDVELDQIKQYYTTKGLDLMWIIDAAQIVDDWLDTGLDEIDEETGRIIAKGSKVPREALGKKTHYRYLRAAWVLARVRQAHQAAAPVYTHGTKHYDENPGRQRRREPQLKLIRNQEAKINQARNDAQQLVLKLAGKMR